MARMSSLIWLHKCASSPCVLPLLRFGPRELRLREDMLGALVAAQSVRKCDYSLSFSSSEFRGSRIG
jgi:hypothetical protein